MAIEREEEKGERAQLVAESCVATGAAARSVQGFLRPSVLGAAVLPSCAVQPLLRAPLVITQLCER